MTDPRGTDEQEADHESGQRGTQFLKRRTQRLARPEFRDGDLEHEDRDDDGEDAVREGEKPIRLRVSARPSVHLGCVLVTHGTNPAPEQHCSPIPSGSW